MSYRQGRQSLISSIRPLVRVWKRTESLRAGSQHSARQTVVYGSCDPAVCSCLCQSNGKLIAANEKVGVEGVAASTGRQNPLPSLNERDLVSPALPSCNPFGEAVLPCFPHDKMGSYIILRLVKFSFSCSCWKILTTLHLLSSFSLLATPYHDSYTAVCIPILKIDRILVSEIHIFEIMSLYIYM